MKTDDSDEYEYCCSDCDGVIAAEAKTCPHCGADTSSLVESSMNSRIRELDAAATPPTLPQQAATQPPQDDEVEAF